MLELLARHWWLLALRGLLTLLFGILALVWPGPTLTVLILFFGAYAFVDGIFALVAAFTHRPGSHWWALLLEGVAGIGIGVITFLWPEITGAVLLALIAAWALVTGIFEIVAAIRLRAVIENEWLLALSGVLSVLFGVVALVWPASAALAIIWIIGAYTILFGVLLLMLAFRLRNLGSGAPSPLSLASSEEDRGRGEGTVLGS